MKRRNFLGLLAGSAAAAASVRAATNAATTAPLPALPDPGYRVTKMIDLGQPITGMTTFRDRLYVTTDRSMYVIDRW